MIDRAFRGFLKHAPMILFIAFVVALCTSIAAIFSGLVAALTLADADTMGEGWWMYAVGSMLRAFMQGFEYAALMLAAAALIFRADKWLEAAE